MKVQMKAWLSFFVRAEDEERSVYVTVCVGHALKTTPNIALKMR
jgi:hypothetical protein